ncbi:hypothetical protein [Chryseobacterium vrystaatense]|uniref:hypothetical protein n=1 Tax=Chryseobacterium vrystaatense TaxID=307480 RepID=UPI00068C5275|nr:hypothetical protein [Chryseobacterium vrystaatense]
MGPTLGGGTVKRTKDGTVYTGSEAAAFRDLMNPSANPPSPKPNFLQRAGSFIRGIFGGNRGAGITTFLSGATISRTGIQIGGIAFEGYELSTVGSLVKGFAATGAMTLGAVLYPTMIKEPEFNWTRDLPLDIPITTTDDRPEDLITLYRGVCIGHYDYKNALKGMAIPLGGHNDPDSHNWGDTESVFTSWTINRNTALKFANKNGSGGVLLQKAFSVHEIIPSPDKYNEQEILIRGIVNGAVPFIQKR